MRGLWTIFYFKKCSKSDYWKMNKRAKNEIQSSQKANDQ
jgi:hypothetical protein